MAKGRLLYSLVVGKREYGGKRLRSEESRHTISIFQAGDE